MTIIYIMQQYTEQETLDYLKNNLSTVTQIYDDEDYPLTIFTKSEHTNTQIYLDSCEQIKELYKQCNIDLSYFLKHENGKFVGVQLILKKIDE